jgi:hypothetical protein
LLAVLDQVGQDLIGVFVEHAGADWNHDFRGLATGSGLLFPAAVLASLGSPEGAPSQLEQRCFSVRGDENDVAAASAVTAVGSAECDEFFPSK